MADDSSSAIRSSGEEPMTEPTSANPREHSASRHTVAARAPFVVALICAAYFGYGAVQLGVGGFTDPGPGLWPLGISIVLALCCMIGLVVPDTDVEGFGRRLLRPAMGIAVLALFILLFERVGLILTGLIVLLFWFKILAKESWKVAGPLAVATTGVAYVLFVVVLGAVFPDDLIASLWEGR